MKDSASASTLLIERAVTAALEEDLGLAGDITTQAVIPVGKQLKGRIVARDAGVVSGIEAALHTMRRLDSSADVRIEHPDGAHVDAGETLIRVKGQGAALLSAERTALNFLGHLCGIATATAGLVRAVGEHPARITCTRKTTPGLRGLEKAAVRHGGGVNHRFGLGDAVLIKDNHIALAGGVGVAIERARANIGHMVKIEVEVDTLDQLSEALSAGPDIVLLDNMSPELLAEAVRMVGSRAITEASGRVSAQSVAAIAASGVQFISAGWITHSAPVLDVALDLD